MSFHIDRKLIFESLDNSTGKTCGSYYCNPEVNHSRICPLSCFYICQGICLFPEIELPQNFTTEVPFSQSPQKNTASIFLIILFTGLGIAVYIFCSLVIHKNSRTSSQPEQQVVVEEEELSDIRTVGLHPLVISTITIRKYKRGEGLIEGTECSVCLSEFREDETFKILPTCNHAFHVPCIDTWLKSHTNCPMCRASIVITIPTTTAFS
ncbi:hypothetical protein R3W88_003494 [Solanum pinnatisectum]|uniref:RING-type domain-containing protein n=1 Tax=Solanum pinnatisectum TaxID=50273 RepID=A0AAV9MSW1_9SOLN|nr:hypothetical protein R3W88_003494 [Solanum pinnatisectum]